MDRVSEETIINTLQGICELYEKDFTTQLSKVWQNALSDLTEQEFHEGVKRYTLSPEGQFMPKPGSIYALARPEGDRRAEATLLVAQLFKAIGPCGPDPIGCQKAKERLPEITWAYIENVGGWAEFSREMQHTNEQNAPIIKAQIRNAIEGLIDRKKAGKSLLLGKDETGGLVQIGNDLQKMVGTVKEISKTDDCW